MRTLGILLLIFSQSFFIQAQHSIAREWNELTLESIRGDFARPTVHARNLFQTSVMMYDIWALVNDDGDPYFVGDTLGEWISQYPEDFDFSFLPVDSTQAYVEEAISYAMFEVLTLRFLFAPEGFELTERYAEFMESKGYPLSVSVGLFPGDSSAVAFGRFVAREMLDFGLQDGSNERFDYTNQYYLPSNPALLVTAFGNQQMEQPNHWQPLSFDVFIDQAGNEIPGAAPAFLSPEWGNVIPFAISSGDSVHYQRDGFVYPVYNDPGPPPYLSQSGEDDGSKLYKEGFAMVGIWSSMLDPEDGEIWDISPGALGNSGELPEGFKEMFDFYDFFDGGDGSRGHSVNPVTGQPYTPNEVPRADYARVLAEFWADGPDSETPPGHWFTILHTVMDHPDFIRQWAGTGDVLDTLEYDVKAFFALGGAMHDAAITTWSAKGWYDYVRPISAIRYMATKGQSTDASLANYHPHGLPLYEGYIEVIGEEDALAVSDSTLIGKIKLKGWRGPDFIENPDVDVAGVGWIPAEVWWPYQRPTFVSPPFAGYTSGHSCFSRAAAEVMTMMTGDAFFPGGIGRFDAPQNEFLVFERGPSVDIELQWATYRDAADQSALSRIWGGIHPPQDDFPGRKAGIIVGTDAFNKAESYFVLKNTTPTVDLPEVVDRFDVYPTLATQSDRLQILSDIPTDVRVVVFDMMGKRVRQEVIRTGETTLDMHGLQSGQYVMNISDGEVVQVARFVIVE